VDAGKKRTIRERKASRRTSPNRNQAGILAMARIVTLRHTMQCCAGIAALRIGFIQSTR
jgi:hypothetical protein